MITRRQVILGAAFGGAVGPSLVGCSSSADEQSVARALRRPVAIAGGDRARVMRELVRFSTLAPSSHNTQCWTFRLQERSVTIAPDLARRCPAVDPDDHHLYVSLGCATENLAQAALANGLQPGVLFNPVGVGAIEITLDSTLPVVSALFNAIPERQCTRADYDGKPLSSEDLRLLEQAGSGNGVRIVLLTGRHAMETVLEHVVAANTVQMQDHAFVQELTTWIRFGAEDAVRTGDGLFAGATGNPAMPRWLGKRMMGWFFTPKSENERYARQIRSSAGIAVIVSDASDTAHWVEAGRCYERFALQATALGIRNALVNQPVEVGSSRPSFSAALGLGGRRPDLVVRFGRGPAMPYSLRRPLDAVLI